MLSHFRLTTLMDIVTRIGEVRLALYSPHLLHRLRGTILGIRRLAWLTLEIFMRRFLCLLVRSRILACSTLLEAKLDLSK